ncbi:MAG: hypothetical protein HY791_26365 [Deltaproteobacteria bacterium]|nr:hypothetical protein [Deltaproteobacteria bacterium]
MSTRLRRFVAGLDPVKSSVFVAYGLLFIVLWFLTGSPSKATGACIRIGDPCNADDGKAGQCALAPCARVRRPPCFRCEPK